MANLYRKALNYDLDDNLLKEHYPNPKSYKNAWRDVKSFLCKNGFEDRQYSGVVSTKPMTSTQTYEVFQMLLNQFEWLEPCILKFDVTDIKKQHSLIDEWRESMFLDNVDEYTNKDTEALLNDFSIINKESEPTVLSIIENTKGKQYGK